MRGFLPDEIRITQVRLRTQHLQPMVEFYSRVLGLKASGAESQASLSASQDNSSLLMLDEDRNAWPRPERLPGLYHFALRYGTRGDLAQAYKRIVATGYRLSGASDHGVSEAIYLSDPDGNGVELYADRPRSQWRWKDGELAIMTTPLDPANLFATGSHTPEQNSVGLPVDLGHIHLHVADLRAAERFYSEFLGFAVTQRSYQGALFFAAGAYHHQIAVNVWAEARVSSPQRQQSGDGANGPVGSRRSDSSLREKSLGLVSYRLEVPIAEILYCLRHRGPLLGYETRMALQHEANPILQIRDPNGTWLEVQASHNPLVAGPGSPWADCAQTAKRRLKKLAMENQQETIAN